MANVNVAVKTGQSAIVPVPFIYNGVDGTRQPIHAIGRTPSNLARVGLIANGYTAQVGGAATISDQLGSLAFNGSGSGSGQAITVPLWTPTTGSGSGVCMYIPFKGSTFGLCVRQDTTINAISVGVDGRFYPMENYQPIFANRSQNPISGDMSVIFADDLDPYVPHVAMVVVPNNPYATNSIRILHMIVDENAGYFDDVKASCLLYSGALTNVLANFPTGTSPNSIRFADIIEFCNNDPAAQTVTISMSGSIIWQKTIPIGGTAFYPEMGGTLPRALQNTPAGGVPQIKASVNTNVQMTIWGKTR